MAIPLLTATMVREFSDSALLDAQRELARRRREVDSQAAVVAAEVAYRSRRDLGDDGLAQRMGARTPQRLIQQITGSSARDAATLVSVGSIPPASPLSVAVASGGLGVDAAAAIHAGLGDDAPAVAVLALIAAAGQLSVEKLGERARELRAELDELGIADREAHLRDRRFLRFSPVGDGMTRISGLLDPESAATVIAAYDHATSPRRGGPRFVDPEAVAAANELLRDQRTTEQIALDSFVDLLRAGAAADPGRLARRRPAVRVLVTDADVARRSGAGHIEGQSAPVSIPTVERHVCDSGVVPVLFDRAGAVVDIGRDQRLFTDRQRIGLAVRDGGCRFGDCDRPPSWCEAHHIVPWSQGGRTDLADGSRGGCSPARRVDPRCWSAMLVLMTSRVLRADDPECRALDDAGWTVSARSWAAQLDAADVDGAALRARIDRVAPFATVRQLTDADASAVLALDRRTLLDYPGGPATRHQPLTEDSARVGPNRDAFGAFEGASPSGELVAMTYIDLFVAGAGASVGDAADTAETDFTVVAPESRGHGLAMAGKATSIQWLLTRGIVRFRTGGSNDNAAIIAANRALGYVRDEEWITMTSP